MSPDDGCSCRSKHVVCVINKWTSEYLLRFIERITLEDFRNSFPLFESSKDLYLRLALIWRWMYSNGRKIMMWENRYTRKKILSQCLLVNHKSRIFWRFADRASTVYLSHYLTNLMHKICFTVSFISCLYMFRAHVLETCRGIK